LKTNKELFSFDDYRDYLRHEFPGKGLNRGRRMLMAKYLNCQTSYLSQVLTDKAHLSLEHAVKTSIFLNHNDEEKKYFMLLVQSGKAGSKELIQYFDAEIKSIKKSREEVISRIHLSAQMNKELQATYYSSWHYLAIHILSALPSFNTIDAMSQKLKLERKITEEALRFLTKHGFVNSPNQGKYSIGIPRLHLSRNQFMLPKHHLNWRLKAMQSLDIETKKDLHYSVLLGISKEDQLLLRDKVLKLIEDYEPIIKDSKEEVPVAFLIDLFEL